MNPDRMTLKLGADQWDHGDGPLTIRVERVRHDLSRYYYGAKVWVEGYRLDDAGVPVEWLQALIATQLLAELPAEDVS